MRPTLFVLLALMAASPVHAQTQSPSRGQLLYANHCVECHSTAMHWRDQRLARDWNSLRAQVRRFQGLARLDWNDEDIEAVSRHLNDTIYQFPRPQARR